MERSKVTYSHPGVPVISPDVILQEGYDVNQSVVSALIS